MLDIIEIKELKFKVRLPSDNYIIKEILEDNVKFLPESSLQNLDTIIDVGAHIGVFSIYYSQFAKEVCAYEPFDENYNLLCENIALNNISIIHPYNLAVVGNKKEKVMLYRSEISNARHTLLPPPYCSNYLIQKPYKIVEAISLDEIMRDKKDKNVLLKLDCEGSEYDIIINSDIQTFNNIKTIIAETHEPENNLTEYNTSYLIEILKSMNYEVEWRLYFRENQIIVGNLLAIKK